MQSGEWRWELSRWLRRYDRVRNVEEYVEAVTAFAEERARSASQLVPGLVLEPDANGINASYRAEERGEGSGAVGSPGPMLFLSWGRPTSKRIARALDHILEAKLPGVDIFFSATSIEPGDDPMVRLFDEGLLRTNALVVVLTEEGAGSPYVIWETAAAWALGALVVPMFVDIEPHQVPGPLVNKVQGIQLRDRDDLLRAINRLRRKFDIEGSVELSDEEWDALQSTLGPRASSFPVEPRIDQPSNKEDPISEGSTPQMLPGWPRAEMVIYYCGPTSWCQWSGPDFPDVTLRIAVALPGAVEQPFRDHVSRLQGERRETSVLEALNRSPLTRWLMAQKENWNWDDEPGWYAYGSGYPDLSEFRFVPSWKGTARQPLQARVSVATGLLRPNEARDQLPAVHLALDLMYQLLELDGDRKPDSVRHQTTPAPAPGALRLLEVAEALLNGLVIGDVAAHLSGHLLATDNRNGEVGMWVQPRGIELERIVRLEGIRRLPGATDAPCGVTAASWPLGIGGGPSDQREFIVDMLLDYLERSGYRQLDGVLDAFRTET
jgi:hypothetical protein